MAGKDQDGQMSEGKESLHHVGFVDTLAILIVPNVFSVRASSIMDDELSRSLLGLTLTFTIGYSIMNIIFIRWERVNPNDKELVKLFPGAEKQFPTHWGEPPNAQVNNFQSVYL